MPVEIKKLKQAPRWVRNISNLRDANEVLEMLKKKSNKAFTKNEIEEYNDSAYTTVLFRTLVQNDILECNGGHYYIKNGSRADTVIDVCN